MDDETRKACDKIEKLMRLAGSNPNEAEAASALAKAQELLTAYNLDMAVVEQAAGKSGKRLEAEVSGGMHRYQRDLWRHISQLNFCMYWTQKVRTREGTYAYGRGRKWTHEHRLIGREVNVVSTRNMAAYIGVAIERLCREYLGPERSMQYYSRDAVAFREGMADRIIEKIVDRREGIIKEEKRKAAQAAKAAAEQGQSLATALTVSGLLEREEEGNYDFIHGEGAFARRKAEEAEWKAGEPARRAERAKRVAEAEAAHAAWATAHPEEARKEAAQERARQRARDRYQPRGGRYRFRETPEEMRRNSGSYQHGYDKGERVGIDPQMDGGKKRISKR